MNTQERRIRRQVLTGRRMSADRRAAIDDDYNGLERRSGSDRRAIIDRRR